MTIDLRFLAASDMEAYRNIRLEALEYEPEAFGSSPEEHHGLSREEITQRISFDPSEKFVVGAFSAIDWRELRVSSAIRRLKNDTRDTSGACT